MSEAKDDVVKALVEALTMARECIVYCRKAHPDAQSESDDGIPVEFFIDRALKLAKGGGNEGMVEELRAIKKARGE